MEFCLFYTVACVFLTIPSCIASQVLSVSQTTQCDVTREPQICVMSRDVGDDAKFDVDIEGEFNGDQLQWYKHYVGLPPYFHSFKERLTAPGIIEENMHLTNDGRTLTISPIKDDDFYETKYWAEIAEDLPMNEKDIKSYQLEEDEVRHPPRGRVYFILQSRPKELGPFLLGDSLRIDLTDYYTPPGTAIEYIWTKSESPLEFKVLDDGKGQSMDLQNMELNDFGIISVRIYGSRENIPGRVQIAEKNFNILLDRSKICRQEGHQQVCQCSVGFHGDGTNCQDVNECDNGIAECLPQAACENTIGSYQCTCPDGYQGDGQQECTDMDECEHGVSGCHRYSYCMNTDGSYRCECQEGYFGNGFDCIEMSKWTPWSPWSPCSETCGSGTRSRSRTCTNPESGMICDGVGMEHDTCMSSTPCPIHGGWSEWSQWSPCSETCGGKRHQVRVCDNPTPLYGGMYCEGDLYKSEECGDTSCPVDGKWSKWGEWTSCSATCGQGERSRFRRCNSPAPSEDGEPCDGAHKEEKPCGDSNPLCLGSGGWSSWSHWGTCTSTCGIGQQFRQRLCRDLRCSGQNQQQKPCIIRNCPKAFG